MISRRPNFAFVICALFAAACSGSQVQGTNISLDRHRSAERSDAGTLGTEQDDAFDCELAEPDDAKEKRPYCCQQDANHNYFRIQWPYCRLSCDNPDVYCVTENGDPLDDETIRPIIAGGRVLVRVVADRREIEQKQVKTRITLRGSAAADETVVVIDHNPNFDAGTDHTSTAGSGLAEPGDETCHGTCQEYRTASFEQVAPDGQASMLVTLTIEEDDRTTVNRNFHFPIISGKRWVEVGLQLPLTLNGTRTVTTAPLAGTGLSTLEVNKSMSWALGVSVMISPLGVWTTRDEDLRPLVIRHLVAPWSLGFGTNVYSPTHSAFREGYLSLNYRFSSDAFIGFGVSAVQGQYLASYWQEHMVLPAGVSVNQVTAERYMFQPMFALTVSASIFSSLTGLVTRAQSSPSGQTSGKSSQ